MEITLDGSPAFSEIRCTNSSEPRGHDKGVRNFPETNVDLDVLENKTAVMSLSIMSVVDQTAKDVQSVYIDKGNLLHRSGAGCDSDKMLVNNTRMATEKAADDMVFTQIKDGVASILSSWDDNMEITSTEDNKVVEVSAIAAVEDDMEMTNIEDSKVTETCLVVASISIPYSDMEMVQGNSTGGSKLEPAVPMMQNATVELVESSVDVAMEMTRNTTMDSRKLVEPSVTGATSDSKFMYPSAAVAMEMTTTDIGKVVDLCSVSVAMEISQSTNTDNGKVVEPSTAVTMEISQNTTNVEELSTDLSTRVEVPTTSSKVVGPSVSVIPVPTVTPVGKPPHGRPPRSSSTTSRSRRSTMFDKTSLSSEAAVASVAIPGAGNNVASVDAPGIENHVSSITTPSVGSNVENSSVVNVATPGIMSFARDTKSVATSGSGRNGTSVRHSSSKSHGCGLSPKPLVHVPQRVTSRVMGRGAMVSTPLSKRAGFVARHTPRFASNRVTRSTMSSTSYLHQSCDMDLVDSYTLLDATPVGNIASPCCVGGSPSPSRVDPVATESFTEYTDGRLEQDLLKTSDDLENVSPLSAATSTETDAVTKSTLTLTSVGVQSDVSTQVAAATTGFMSRDDDDNEGNWLQTHTQDTSLVLVDSSFGTGSAEDTYGVKLVMSEKTTRSGRKRFPFAKKKRIPLRDSLIENLKALNKEVNGGVEVATPEMVQVEYREVVPPAEHSTFASPEVTTIEDTLRKRQSLMMSPSGFTKFLVNLNCDKTLSDHTFSVDLESTTPAACVEVSTMGGEGGPCIVQGARDSEQERSGVEGDDELCVVQGGRNSRSDTFTQKESVYAGERVSPSSPLALSGHTTSLSQPHSHIPTGSPSVHTPSPDRPLPISPGARVPSPNRSLSIKSPSVHAYSSDQPLSHLRASVSTPPSSLYDDIRTPPQSEVVFCSVSPEAPSSPVIPAPSALSLPSLHQISPPSLMPEGSPVVQDQKPHDIACRSAFIMHVHSLRAR